MGSGRRLDSRVRRRALEWSQATTHICRSQSYKYTQCTERSLSSQACTVLGGLSEFDPSTCVHDGFFHWPQLLSRERVGSHAAAGGGDMTERVEQVAGGVEQTETQTNKVVLAVGCQAPQTSKLPQHAASCHGKPRQATSCSSMLLPVPARDRRRHRLCGALVWRVHMQRGRCQ